MRLFGLKVAERRDICSEELLTEDRKGSESPISDTTDGGVGVGRVDNQLSIQTAATFADILSPEIADRPALKNEKKEIVGAVGGLDGHDCIDDKLLDFGDRDSE